MPEPDCSLRYHMRYNAEFYYVGKIPPIGIGLQRRVVSQWFLPRDAVHKRGLCRHAVSVCVCLSVTFVDCVKTNKHSIKIVSLLGSHIILVFQRITT